MSDKPNPLTVCWQFIKRTLSNDTNRVIPLFVFALVSLSAIVGALAYQMGERQGRKSFAITTDHKGTSITADDIQKINLENELLKGEVSALIQERDISLNNINAMRDELQAIKDERDEYKALNDALSAHAQSNGEVAHVIDVNIDNLENNNFAYRFDVLIPSSSEQHFVPNLTLFNPTSMVNIPLSPKVYHAKGVVTVRGKFTMPKGFTPNQLRLTLKVADKEVVKIYNWRISQS